MLAHFFAALAFAYLGMLALCQGLDRHYKQVWGKPPSPRLSRLLRVSGWVSLGLSFYFCGLAWGWAMGPVGWLGMLSLSGFGLLMLLPYRPRLAVWLPMGFVPVWAVFETLT
ncbi:DUF3325 domain-containing protein [Pseudomonas psychrophila]|uniref:DUF3325 domain-containing protein n=1 Tax=Pseudomonas psychrophila TaxID=122355 RepID=UPI000357A099|nr:DUF3325 domain-containing protein [Pseudomonas psychrophila]EPJ91808.1 hypothetical protein CF149_20131 [Pseudomonas psychrophila]